MHRSKLASISCGRGSGSASRYVDMAVQLDSEERIEFTNIAREELGVLNDYIHKTLIPAMQSDANGSESVDEDSAVAVEVVEDNQSIDSDDDEEETSAGKRRRPSRAASRTAREATRAHFDRGVDDSDDEDEEDFQNEDGSDSGSDSSDPDTDGEEVVSTDEEGAMETHDESEDEFGGHAASKKPRV